MELDYSSPFLQVRQLSDTPNVPAKSVCNISIWDPSIPDSKPRVQWDNCCTPDEPFPSANCPPKTTDHDICPLGYHSCADALSHPEMCNLVENKTYSDALPMANKCCPLDYSCGPDYESPCQYRFPDSTNSTTLGLTRRFTNPQYAATPGVFSGCDRHGLAPSAIGAIIATGVIAFCLITAFLLWLVRRRIYRDPRRRASRQRLKMLESSRTNSISSTAPISDLEGGTEKRLKPGEFEMVVPPCRVEKEKREPGGDEARIEITVTREVQIQTIEEHIEELRQGQSGGGGESVESLVSEGGSGSSGTAVEACGKTTSEESLGIPRQRWDGGEVRELERAVTMEGRMHVHMGRPDSRASMGYADGYGLQPSVSLQGRSWLFDEKEEEGGLGRMGREGGGRY